MIGENRSYRHLDNLLAGLEDSVLELTDQEVTVESSQVLGSVGNVRGLIGGSLESHTTGQVLSKGHEPDTAPGHPAKSRMDVPRVPVPSHNSDKRRLLEQLVAHRSGIPGELRVAFSGRRTLSDAEIDAMVERLVRLGILHREDNDD